jgi:hypothetical protein
LNRAKNFLGTAYHHTKSFLNDVDHGVKTFRHVYNVVEPFINKYSNNNNKLHAPVQKALNGYESIKSKVLEADNDLNQVKKRYYIKNKIYLIIIYNG